MAVVLYLAVNFAFLMIFAKVYEKNEGAGCLFQTIGGTVLHGILMSLMIAFLIPILLGGTSATPISGIVAAILPIIIIGVVAIVIVAILSLFPFISHSPGIQAFLEGVIIFRLMTKYGIEQLMANTNVQVTYPGIWASIGFLIIAGILVRLIMFGFSLISASLEYTTIGELMPEVIGPVLGILGAFIPLFMYASYVGSSISQTLPVAVSNNSKEISQEWPEFTTEELSEYSAIIEKAKQEPLLDNDLESLKRVIKNYTKRTGRPMTKEQTDLLIKSYEIIFKYSHELFQCLLLSIDSKKPCISNELKFFRTQVESLGLRRKSDFDDDLKNITSAANREVWINQYGQNCYPLTRNDVLSGLEQAKIIEDNCNKISAVFKEVSNYP